MTAKILSFFNRPGPTGPKIKFIDNSTLNERLARARKELPNSTIREAIAAGYLTWDDYEIMKSWFPVRRCRA